MTDTERILDILRKEIQAKGLTTAALARMTGYHENTLFNLGRNSNPKLETIATVAQALDLRLQLVERSQPLHDPAVMEQEVQRRVAKRLHQIQRLIHQELEGD